ncbi:thioredoxin family protein [Colwellia sp. E2M01]|uniref:thioredoxin family protein n=1 Tax=Colwellia sp. E2M01 TaxID=2841561 RepID=UPI001C094573|nr:thioredoxin family protein [Colwellia sp. E2M01]MBU2871678.1 thioredoxin family protein [Colwellia sp. E2M01]
MIKTLLLFITLLTISSNALLCAFASAKVPPLTALATHEVTQQLPTYSKIYDDKRDPFSDANAALALAQKTNRHVLIEVGGNWCSWCHKMDTFLTNTPEVYKALHNQYVLLKVNVSDSNENEAFMKSLPPTLGYPHIYVSNAQGKMLLSKDTAELLENNEYSKSQWMNFLEQWSMQNTLASALLSNTAASEQ